MSALSLASPFPIFTDIDGDPLESGYLYIGAAGLNPETNPISVYWDAALTVPAAQPIRTINGYPSRNGAPAVIYTSVDCSVLVKNKNGSLIFSALNQTSRLPASLISYPPSRTLGDKILENGISVKDYGALGTGTDDRAAILLARAAAAAAGVPLIFPSGVYGISDGLSLTENGLTDVWFEPGATLKLLGNTASGGMASVWDGVATTVPVRIYNASFDADEWPGENAISGVHPVGVTFYNLTVRNCKHDAIQPWFGGKAIQWEGAGETRNAQVFGFIAENCTVGIDVGAPTGATFGFTHIGFFGVSMRNVDIPIHLNDTTGNSVPDSSDQVELFVDGIQCRNCGKLTYPTSTSTGGGIIVMERGVKATVRNMQVVNDQGTYGTTDYGGIGALVRGQGKGLVLENVLVSASSIAAVFDFNPASFQSPYTGDVASYVLADNIRVYANVDYIVKCLPGGGKLGAGLMRGIEIGGTEAALAGIVDANAAAYTNTYLEVIDRENNFVSTGLLYLQQIDAFGNQLQGGSAIVGISDLVLREGNWVPIDASGAGLIFTGVTGYWQRIGKMVTCWCTLTFPATADASFALIGGLPFTIANVAVMRASGIVTFSNNSGVAYVYPVNNSTTFPLNAPDGSGVTNATASGSQFGFVITYLPSV